LGVSTASYLPYCFFNFLSPILDVLYGFVGFKVPSASPPTETTHDLERPDARVVPAP
jgi:NhaC family Na+:H+ antiporter